MDVIDLWELLYNVDDWSFETFPWDLFSLCHSTIERNPPDEVIIKNEDVQESESLFSEQLQNSSEIISFNHVPPEEVPNDPVVQNVHSNQTFHTENNEDYQNALLSSEEENLEESQTDQNSLIDSSKPNNQTLEESMLILDLSLKDRSTLSAFEKIKKKKDTESMEVAKLSENSSKNRYKDVLPYDNTRVILEEGMNGDYINASFVQMPLPHPRKPNEYIAAQGPLPETCGDFWQMVWEQHCKIIVMVTTLKERNRVKCHQYWPDLYQTETYDQLQVVCFSETANTSEITRDFLVSNQKTNEERHITQLQYINWPDHGVPEDFPNFLAFVQQLRELRRDAGGVVVIHCSAGVGRTGVVILMETALGYMDADEPIYPLKLLQIMRDQRVMMVQTVVQYKFICESLLKAYNDKCKIESRVELEEEEKS